MGVRLPDFVVSDTHFFHHNIIKYQGRPSGHEDMMVKRWRRVVKGNHTVLHLGDLFFGGEEGYERFRSEIAPKLTGQVRYLVLGNHDRKKWDYEALGFTVIKPFTCVYRDYRVSFDHYPKLIDESDTRRVHIHGHIHSNPYARDEPTRFGNINVSVEVLDYRPHRVTRLLNSEIRRRNQHGRRYLNSRGYRWNKTDRMRRAA